MAESRSGVYGLDTAPGPGGSGMLDSQGHLLPQAVVPLWNSIAPHLSESRRRILYTNDVTMGKTRAPVPKKFARNRGVFGPKLPMPITTPLHTHSVAARKDPRLKRYTSGTSIASLQRASRVEQWLNPLERKVLSWDELVGMYLYEGEGAVNVIPSDLYQRAIPAPPFEGPDGQPLETYWRDADGNDPKHESYASGKRKFKRNGTRTAEAHEEALQDWKLRNPYHYVDIVHPTDCYPVGLRIGGDGPEIEGLLIRRAYSRAQLSERFAIVEPAGNTAPTDMTVYEAWMNGPDGPYVTYSVLGQATRWADDNKPAIIDLAKEYGMHRLLAFYDYGAHRPVGDLDMRGVPFFYPFADASLGIEAMLGATIANTYANGYGARGIKIDKETPKEAYLEGTALRKFKWEIGGDIPILPGELVDILPQRVSDDLWRAVDLLMGGIAQEAPPPGAFGGEGPDSGRERTVMRRHLEDSQHHVFEGALRVYRKVGGALLELECARQAKDRPPTPVATTSIVAREGGSRRRQTQIVTLDPNDVGGNYEVEAIFLPKPGENLAANQQAMDAVERGFRSRRWLFEEVFGDEEPEIMEAEIASDKLVVAEQGQAEIYELARQIRGEDLRKEREKMVAAGRVGPISGMPLAMAGGLGQPPMLGPGQQPQMGAQQGPQGQGQLAGLGLPSQAGAALGGQVATEMETPSIMADARAIDGAMGA